MSIMHHFGTAARVCSGIAGALAIVIFITGKESLPALWDSMFPPGDQRSLVAQPVAPSQPAHVSVDSGGSIKKSTTRTGTTKAIVDDDNFFLTFIKTPLVLFLTIISFFGCLFMGAIETAANIFFGFEHGYNWTTTWWHWTWHQVDGDWYWRPGGRWALGISLSFWSLVLFGSSNR